MLEIVICDDNERCLNNFNSIIEKTLRDHNINGRIVCKANCPEIVEEFIKHKSANVYFLDIDFKNCISGYSLAKKIRERDIKAYIVFVSGHLEYVLQAFKIKTFDFLPKPVSPEILEQCLLNMYSDYIGTTNVSYDCRYIEVKSGASIYRIKNSDIVFIEKLNSKTLIHMASGIVTCTETLEALNKTLNDESFIRCHKSFIANKTYISEIHLNKNEIVFETGQVCYIGRKYKKGLVYDD